MEPILFSLNSICTAFDLECRQDAVAPMFFIDGKLKEWHRWGATVDGGHGSDGTHDAMLAHAVTNESTVILYLPPLIRLLFLYDRHGTAWNYDANVRA